MAKNVSLSDHQLKELLKSAKQATPTPWFVREEDDHTLELIAVCTDPCPGKSEPFPRFNPRRLFATRMVATSRSSEIEHKKWVDNVLYIAAAANALPLLVEELLELRRGKPSK